MFKNKRITIGSVIAVNRQFTDNKTKNW